MRIEEFLGRTILDLVDLAVWRRTGIKDIFAIDGQRQNIEFRQVSQHRALAGWIDLEDLAVVARTKIHITFGIGDGRPHQRLLGVEYEIEPRSEDQFVIAGQRYVRQFAFPKIVVRPRLPEQGRYRQQGYGCGEWQQPKNSFHVNDLRRWY